MWLIIGIIAILPTIFFLFNINLIEKNTSGIKNELIRQNAILSDIAGEKRKDSSDEEQKA